MPRTPRSHLWQVAATAFFGLFVVGYLTLLPKVKPLVLNGYADFSTFYTAGQLVSRGLGHDLYDINRQLEIQREFSQAAQLRQRPLPYLHPAFEAWLFVPLAHLSYPAAYVTFASFNLLCVLLGAFLLRWQLPEVRNLPRLLYYGAVLAFWPIVYGVGQGQDSGIFFLLWMSSFLLVRKGKDASAGIVLGLALIKFHLVLPLVCIFLMKKQWKLTASIFGTSIVLAAAGAAAAGWQIYREYPPYLLQMNQERVGAAIFPSTMANVRGLLQGGSNAPGGIGVADLITAAVSVGLLLWAARFWQGWANRHSNVFVTGFALATTVSILCAYHTNSYDLGLVLPWLLVAISMGMRVQKGWITRTLLAGPASILLFVPLYPALAIWMDGLRWMAIPLLLLALGWTRLTGFLENGDEAVPVPVHS